MSDDKQFDPTPSKLKKLREDGQSLKAGLTAKIIGYFSLFSILYFAWPTFRTPELALALTIPGALRFMAQWLILIIKIQILILLPVGLIQLCTELYISGGNMAIKNVKPNAERLNPTQYFAKVKENCLQIPLKLLIALLIILTLAYSINPVIVRLVEVSGKTSLARANAYLYTLFSSLYTKLAILVVLTIGTSYFFSYRKYMKKAKMSLQEMRDEVKNTEGDPHVKGQQREIMRELSESELVTRIKKAGVVILED